MDPVHPSPTLEFLHVVSSRIAAADPLHEVLDGIVAFVSEFVNCDSCFLYVLEGKELVLRASKNPHPEVLDSLRIRLGEGITGWVADHKEPVVIERNASNDPRFRSFPELPEDTYESFLSIPVISRGRVVSVLNVQHRQPYSFTPREIKAISTIGHLVGAAIEMARLQEEVSELTGKLEARKLIERAKGIVQVQFGLSEEEADSSLKKQARSRRKSMREIAEAILLTEELRQMQRSDNDDAA